MQPASFLKSVRPSYIRQILEVATSTNVISLAGGLPATELFPMDLIQEASAHLVDTPSVFQYGDTRGYKPLLQQFGELLERHHSHESMICNGSQQGLDLIARAFVQPGDLVVMEAPGYLGALQVFELAQAQIRVVPQLNDGPDLQALETLFKQEKVTLFYGVPDFHNPTGVCWSLPVRQRVAQLCEQYGVALVEDTPYRQLRFSGEPLPLVSSLCPDNALVLQSFSKILVPGVRLGAVSGPETWLKPLLTIKEAADLHTNVPMQALVLALLNHSQYPQHLVRVRSAYAARYQALNHALQKELEGGFEALEVQGGMFMWLTLPGCDARQLAQIALQTGVAIVPGDEFFPADYETPNCIRLNFSHSTPEVLAQAAERLKLAIDQTRAIAQQES
ncbi:PLP-dependent aminotransferase family protein [Pseudomaricurvus alkylphenolicus]|uniref:aminotransferase-like domain-containing protein n=1 Tax=Pseudomaricurvus alkylphenolicus TaxID=1306991 RepID=UPI001424A5E4|nr:PLP-dependent aminotransferase family protein [Pseudomaricurvus alkylphenolicus]NIB40727.1 PLP-dependent aminotransferase family protein [Pseudomaricurvus alkylphenolicus]